MTDDYRRARPRQRDGRRVRVDPWAAAFQRIEEIKAKSELQSPDEMVIEVTPAARMAGVPHSVRSFAQQRTRRFTGFTTTDDLYAAYEKWCRQRQLTAVRRDVFVAQFKYHYSGGGRH